METAIQKCQLPESMDEVEREVILGSPETHEITPVTQRVARFRVRDHVTFTTQSVEGVTDGAEGAWISFPNGFPGLALGGTSTISARQNAINRARRICLYSRVLFNS